MTKEPLRDRWGRLFAYKTPQYVMIRSNEDGDDPNHWVNAEELHSVLADLDAWGITQFIPGVPLIHGSTHTVGVQGWPAGAVLLLEVRVIRPDADGSLPDAGRPHMADEPLADVEAPELTT